MLWDEQINSNKEAMNKVVILSTLDTMIHLDGSSRWFISMVHFDGSFRWFISMVQPFRFTFERTVIGILLRSHHGNPDHCTCVLHSMQQEYQGKRASYSLVLFKSGVVLFLSGASIVFHKNILFLTVCIVSSFSFLIQSRIKMV